MARLLGIDIGTSGCRTVAIDDTGRVVAERVESYPISRPHPLWSEQDPADWWIAVGRCLSSLALQMRLIGSADRESQTASAPTKTFFKAVGLTGQMHGAVFLDKNDLVIRPAILWNDQRTTEECADIERIVGADRVREITCNPPLTGFQLPKILWLRKHEPENFARVRKVLLPKDYIRFLLTGVFATEVSDASGTGIFDVARRQWSTEMMSALDIDASLFPKCVESSEQSGQMVDGTPVFGGGGDQAAGAVGTGAVAPGTISVSLGTSGVVFSCLDSAAKNPDGSLHTFCHANGGWHAMGVMLACGGAVSWYASEVRHASVEDVLAEAALAEPGCGGLTFLPYLSGERSPHNDPRARASFSGLTLSHSSKEMSRAVVEGVTFGLRDCYEAMNAMAMQDSRSGPPPPPPSSAPPPQSSWAAGEEFHQPPAIRASANSQHPTADSKHIRVTGGGAKSRFWVQMVADVLGATVETLEADEGPAFGAALIAGVGAGVWPSMQEACDACIRPHERFTPSGVDYTESYRRYRSLYPHLKGWFGARQ